MTTGSHFGHFDCGLLVAVDLGFKAPSIQKTRYVDPMLVQCWPSVFNAGPTLYQRWINVSCSPGTA